MINCDCKVFFVLPAYNEEENLPILLDAISEVMKKTEIQYEIFLVDDGSKDKTLAIAKEKSRIIPMRIIVHEKNMNLGLTIRDGLEEANKEAGNGDIIITMDADNSHDPIEAPEIIERIKKGAELVIASRYLPGSVEIGLSFKRSMLSRSINWMLKTGFPVDGIRDYTCGFRGYSAAIIKKGFKFYGKDFIEQKGFTCMAEIILKIRPFLKCAEEIPFRLRYDLKMGSSKMKICRTIASYISLIIKNFLRKNGRKKEIVLE